MTKEEIIQKENLVYQKPELLNDVPMHYCPGCSHGVVHKLVSEVIAEMGMADKTIAVYGMTGGQMAPTTLMGMKTVTCPYGREASLHGYPLKMADIAAGLEGTCYVTRQSVQNVASILKAKKAIRKAFDYSMQGKGSSLVEVVSTCNTNWRMSPDKANKWMVENMFPYYPLGDMKDNG